MQNVSVTNRVCMILLLWVVNFELHIDTLLHPGKNSDTQVPIPYVSSHSNPESTNGNW